MDAGLHVTDRCHHGVTTLPDRGEYRADGATNRAVTEGVCVDGDLIIERISPVPPVVDLDAALGRYRRLGFDAKPYSGAERYGFVDAEVFFFHLTEWKEHDPARTGAHVYLYVSDAGALPRRMGLLRSRGPPRRYSSTRSTACESSDTSTPTGTCTESARHSARPSTDDQAGGS